MVNKFLLRLRVNLKKTRRVKNLAIQIVSLRWFLEIWKMKKKRII